MIDQLQIWNDCVAAAKNKLQKNSSGYQIIRGNVLKEAQRAYCAIITASSI
jgi:hypothetical protein